MAESNNGKQKTLKKGDKVRLVTAKLDRVDATVDRVHPDGKVDLTAVIGETSHTITGCAFDPDAKTTDSFHLATEAADGAAEESKG